MIGNRIPDSHIHHLISQCNCC